jgi:hypothetical protein
MGKRRNMKRKGVQHSQKAPITAAIMVVILYIVPDSPCKSQD